MFFRAKIAQFYGWSHEYIEEMPFSVALEYYQAITVIEAQERLIDLKIADYPRMLKADRNELFKKFNKMAYPDTMRKEMDFDEFFRIMGHG